jgi:hypothetical protein
LRATLYTLTSTFGGILYFEPETPLKDVRSIVERMIEYGIVKIYDDDDDHDNQD